MKEKHDFFYSVLMGKNYNSNHLSSYLMANIQNMEFKFKICIF